MKPIHTLRLFALLSALSRGTILNTTITPPGCRKLNTDIGWPSREVWENSLPDIIATPGSDAYGPLPDYRLQVKTVSDVQFSERWAVGDGSETSANPGWRRAVALIVGRKSDTANFDGLRTLAPDMDMYINEGSVNEETESFWGSNYPRLSEIKSRYDPNMTFWVSPGINADFVQAVDGRACLVDPVPSTPSRFPPVTERRHMTNMTVDGKFLFGDLKITVKQFPQPGTEIGLQARPLNGSPCRQRL
ncbi:hypothetical protein BKA60DRAFT_545490 [Fusarium oxysporum]|nr:hypothetical protein BKA60DRAFT_545490 [Fusarium oxysporum]